MSTFDPAKARELAYWAPHAAGVMLDEAADEVERLRAANAALSKAVCEVNGQMMAAELQFANAELRLAHSRLDAMGVPACGRLYNDIAARLDWVWKEFERIEKVLTAIGRRDLAAAIRVCQEGTNTVSTDQQLQAEAAGAAPFKAMTEAAIEAEREACAKRMDELRETVGAWAKTDGPESVASIKESTYANAAAAIRARSQEGAKP